MKIQKCPYHLFGVATLLLLCAIFSSDLKKLGFFDLHLYDTYFIVSTIHLFIYLAILLFVFWMIYVLTSKILLSRILTWLHIVVTIILAAIIIFIIYAPNKAFNNSPDFRQWSSYPSQSRAIAIVILLWLSGQLLFLVNLVGGVLKLINKQR